STQAARPAAKTSEVTPSAIKRKRNSLLIESTPKLRKVSKPTHVLMDKEVTIDEMEEDSKIEILQKKLREAQQKVNFYKNLAQVQRLELEEVNYSLYLF